ncbi:triose-phosphate isomerase family protein [Anaerocolumna sp. MB42-C2]|uniref:triose-phosphate isomerase family protein n=1 Tax=Anaerocolumna sp. MB42-C2 TaxID=3070997 RepID=UPI0027E14DA9|nr:triose-phosphate isomerase family protein [Anaerocolumna sp. MB42-C2]WMJ86620.1 triose-phosphate isomerase family protein [Anaerocolumna sp. MB42-C2]
MKYIYLNLKRFDIPTKYGGVNRIADPREWGEFIVSHTQKAVNLYNKNELEFVMFLPEAHLIGAIKALEDGSSLEIGSQSIYREDTAVGGNFGAFTAQRTGNAMKAIGCTSTIIGHCEERKDKTGILTEAGITDTDAVNRILNKEIKAAIAAGLKVLYCIGESMDEQVNWQEVLRKQLEIGLDGVDMSRVTIAYEPIWAIGPGKIPPDKEYIKKIAKFVKEVTKGCPVVYGGGLKTDNANMLASISEIDGGLIALTRFQGEIGFYPEEYLEIIKTYLGK